MRYVELIFYQTPATVDIIIDTETRGFLLTPIWITTEQKLNTDCKNRVLKTQGEYFNNETEQFYSVEISCRLTEMQ